MKIVADPACSRALLILDAGLRGAPKDWWRIFAAAGPHCEAIGRAAGECFTAIEAVSAKHMRLAERIDAARAGETSFHGDAQPLGIVADAEALGLAWQRLANVSAGLAGEVLGEAKHADRGARDELRHAQQLAAAVRAILTLFLTDAVAAVLPETGVIGGRFGGALLTFTTAATRHSTLMDEVQRQLAQPRGLRRLFAHRRKRLVAEVTTVLLDAFADLGAVAAEIVTEIGVEAPTQDALFLALAAGLPLPPFPDTRNGDPADG